MSKRRLVNAAASEEDEEGPEKETPEQRRSRRDRERRSKKKRSGDPSLGILAGRSSWVRWGAVGGGVVAIVAVITVVLLTLPHSCLAISAPPATSGVPSESAWSWCVNSTDAIVEQMNVHLTITVGGADVAIPGGIGQLAAGKWTSGGQPSQACDMPIYTVNATGGGTDSGGYIEIASPWDFTYTLADFFSLWHDSYSTVTVGGTSEPVSYTGTQLFNYSANSAGTQVVRLWIDGTPSTGSGGPATVLNYLEDSQYASSEIPQCYGQQDGTDHSIVITWGWIGAGEVQGGPSLFQTSASTFMPVPPAGPVVTPATEAVLYGSMQLGAPSLVLLRAEGAGEVPSPPVER